MGSSEKMDTGPARSRFSRTCSLLHQYMKENGGLGELSLGLIRSGSPAAPDIRETLDLLPKIEKSGYKPQASEGGEWARSPAVEKGNNNNKMTIFYGGEVIVLDDFPADKANEIMALAGKFSAVHNVYPSAAAAAAFNSPAPPVDSAATFRPIFAVRESHHPLLPLRDFTSDLPFVRKHSLARFLAKRKERISSNAPYKVNKSKSRIKKKGDEDTWLGL